MDDDFQQQIALTMTSLAANVPVHSDKFKFTSGIHGIASKNFVQASEVAVH